MIRGDILLAKVTFTDESGSKIRPVLVVSGYSFNKGEDVVVVPITSNPQPDDPHVIVIEKDSPHFGQTKLKERSGFKWAKPLTLAKSTCIRKLGYLHADMQNEIRDKLVAMLS